MECDDLILISRDVLLPSAVKLIGFSVYLNGARSNLKSCLCSYNLMRQF